MANVIPTYEVPQHISIRPSNAGYEAAMVSGRRIGGITREGNADLNRGLMAIGAAFDRREVKAERNERRQEAALARAERAQERGERRDAAEQKKRDNEIGQGEILKGIASHAALVAKLDKERTDIIRNTRPDEIPAALARFQQERVQPAYEEYTQSFQSSIGQKWARQQYQGSMRSYQHLNHVDGGIAMGHAVTANLEETKNTLLESVRAGNTDWKKASEDLRHAYNGVKATTQPGTGSPGTGEMLRQTAESVTDQDMMVFRTLEGNASGHADYATSDKGALGRNQILPETAARFGFTDKDRLLHDAEYNTAAAKAYVSFLSKRFNGDLGAMVVSYHSGEGAGDKWLAAGRDDSVLGPKGRQYIQNARDHGFVGSQQADGTVGKPQMNPSRVDAAIDEQFKRNNRELALAHIERVARDNPGLARQILTNDQSLRGVLKEADIRAAENHITGREHAAVVQHKADLKNSAYEYQTNATQKASGYLSEMQPGKTPPDLAKRIQDDPDLPVGLKTTMLKSLNDFHGAEGAVMPWNQPRTASRPEVRQELLDGLHKKPTDPDFTSPEKIMSAVGSNKITPGDGAMLMQGLDPSNDQAKADLAITQRTFKDLHDKLAPPLPDGSRNEAGERAFLKAQDTIWDEVKTARDKAGVPATVTLDPNRPEYLLKDNRVSKFAPTPADLHSAKVPEASNSESMPDDMTLRQQYNDLPKPSGKDKNNGVESFEDWKGRMYPAKAAASGSDIPSIYAGMTPEVHGVGKPYSPAMASAEPDTTPTGEGDDE